MARRPNRLAPASFTGAPALTQGSVLGGLLEGFVVCELMKQAGW